MKLSCFLFFIDDLYLQIIDSISPKTSVKNSSAQWAIFLLNVCCGIHFMESILWDQFSSLKIECLPSGSPSGEKWKGLYYIHEDTNKDEGSILRAPVVIFMQTARKRSFCTLHRTLADIMWRHSEFLSSQLEKRIVTSLVVGKRSDRVWGRTFCGSMYSWGH